MINNCPLVTVKFKGLLENFGECEVSGYSVAEIFRGLSHRFESYDATIYKLILNEYCLLITVNGEPLSTSLDDIQTFKQTEHNELIISTALQMEGENALGIVAGLGLGALALTGVGFLGISATTFGLLGASLLFSSVFKTPKVDTKEKNEKRSVNFSGVNNVVGSGASLPLAFGQVWIGSTVASAYLLADRRSVN